MATRLALPKLPRISVTELRPDFPASARAIAARKPTSREGWQALLWKAAFLPYWVWSDIPSPTLPARDQPLPSGGQAGDHIARTLRSIARRTWLQRALTILARGLCLLILVAVVWLAIELLGGPDLDSSVFPALAIVVLLPAVVLAILSWPTRNQVARMLDQSFHLQERMVTALANIGRDVPASGERAGIHYLQVADAANAVEIIRADPAFRVMPPIRELVLGIICGLAFASLFFLRGGGGDVLPLESRVVPEFIPAAQRFVTAPQDALPIESGQQDELSLAEIQALAEQSNAATQDLQSLADALEDHAFTRSVATSLNQGDYDQAAQTLRDIAQNAPQLSESERAGLASDLDSAASAMTSENTSLADASTEAAEGLREGETAASEGMEQLGDAVQQSGESITPRETLDEAMQHAQQSESAAGQDQASSEQGGQQDQSLFANQPAGMESQQNAEATEGGEPGSAESGEAEGSSGSETGDQPGPEQGAEQGSSRTGESNAGNVAQAPSEDVLPAEGTGAYEEPETLGNPQSAQGLSEESTTGAGAGSDSSGETAGETGGAQSGETGEDLPDPSEAEVTNAENPEGGEQGAAENGGRGTVVLNRSPEGESIRIQGSGSDSSFGSGAGQTTASGGSAQEEVGLAGPDSNHVPGEYRPIVETYFSNDDE